MFPMEVVVSAMARTDGGTRRLRVAHVAPYDPAGGNGVARAVLNWARVLPNFDIEMEIWDFSPFVTSPIEADSKLCRVFRLPCHENRLKGLLSLPEATRRFLAQRVKCVDALHLHSVFRPENHWAASWACHLSSAPIMATIRNCSSDDRAGRNSRRDTFGSAPT